MKHIDEAPDLFEPEPAKPMTEDSAVRLIVSTINALDLMRNANPSILERDSREVFRREQREREQVQRKLVEFAKALADYDGDTFDEAMPHLEAVQKMVRPDGHETLTGNFPQRRNAVALMFYPGLSDSGFTRRAAARILARAFIEIGDTSDADRLTRNLEQALRNSES